MTYLTEGQNYYPGQLATTEDAEIITAINGSTAIIPFGHGVIVGATDKEVRLPIGAGYYFMGVTMMTDTIEKRDGYSLDANGDMGWPVDYPISLVRKGVIAVPVVGTFTKGAPLYMINSGANAGKFSDSATGADLIANSVCWETLSADGLGLIRLGLA